MPQKLDLILAQMDQALKAWSDLAAQSQYDDCSDMPDDEVQAVISRLSSVIERLSPKGSSYQTSFQMISRKNVYPGLIAQQLSGVLSALRSEYELGYLQTVEQLVHAETFAGFLEMADYLQQQGYKDAAAVIAGSVLEQHLRELCVHNGIATDLNGRPKKADLLNSELAAQVIYNKLEQKNVTSWLGLRNHSAHGEYDSYDDRQVRLMIDAISEFMTRNPA